MFGRDRAAAISKLDREMSSLGGKTEQLDTARKFKKAELDSLRSLYDGMVERGEGIIIGLFSFHTSRP